ncbi:Mss4-like protein [Amanita muscaria]
MTGEHKVYKGGCICGAVSYQVVGKPVRSAYCHCTLCQRLNGSAFIHTIHYPAAAFMWTHGELQQDVIETYSTNSKPWKIRSCCKKCGCCVSSHNTKTDRISVWGAQLERDEHGRIKEWEDLKPKAHIFYGTRMLDVHDSLLKWEGYDGESERLG